jgi:hypothetical protein
MTDNGKQIHVELLISSILRDLTEIEGIANSNQKRLLDPEAGNIGAIYIKAAVIAHNVRHVGRAA